MTAVPAPSSPSPDRSPARVASVVQAAVRLLWLYVLPALLAATFLRFFVPTVGTGVASGAVARVAHGYPVAFLAVAFLVFSALARYWRFYMPGGRHASRLPPDVVPGERDGERLEQWARLAESLDVLSAAATRARVSRTTDAASLTLFDERVAEAHSAMRAGDWEGAQQATKAATTLGAVALAQRARQRTLGTGIALVAAAAAVFAVRARVAEPYEVENRSMLPTLHPGDRIGASKLGYGSADGELPARGDVIVFRSSQVPGLGSEPLPPNLVKRVIGLPGDRIEVNAGVPIINGWPVPSCDAGQYLHVVPDADGATVVGRVRVEFLGDRVYLTVRSGPGPGLPEPYVVRPGEVFVLGDNRTSSFDSRAWNGGRGGGVPRRAIQGLARWFLVGPRLNGEADLGRFLRPLDGLEGHLHTDGISGAAVEEGIARCLRQRPAQALPPPPESAQATNTDRGPGR
jgi:signal peptidase I